jgi:MFS superfamily sulfate permease-like transporter
MGPVLFLAAATAFVLSIPILFGADSVPLLCTQNCCGGITVSLLGILPVRMAFRQGVRLHPGMGFVIPILGVFMGGVIGAIVQVGLAPLPAADLRDSANLLFDNMLAELERQGESTEMLRRADFVETALFCGRYGVLLVAVVSAMCAGFVGFVSAVIAGRIASPPPSPGSRPGPHSEEGPPQLGGD